MAARSSVPLRARGPLFTRVPCVPRIVTVLDDLDRCAMETGYCVFPEEEFFPEHELLAVERVNEVMLSASESLIARMTRSRTCREIIGREINSRMIFHRDDFNLAEKRGWPVALNAIWYSRLARELL